MRVDFRSKLILRVDFRSKFILLPDFRSKLILRFDFLEISVRHEIGKRYISTFEQIRSVAASNMIGRTVFGMLVYKPQGLLDRGITDSLLSVDERYSCCLPVAFFAIVQQSVLPALQYWHFPKT